MELDAVEDAHEVAVPHGLEVQTPKPDFESGWEGSELPMEYLCPLYSVRITIVTDVGNQIFSARPPYLACQLSGFSTAGSKFLSIACQAWMVSAGDNGVYTGSGLRGVIPYIQCVAAMFLSQVCS
jgi:hypothetical protein